MLLIILSSHYDSGGGPPKSYSTGRSSGFCAGGTVAFLLVQQRGASTCVERKQLGA